MKCTNIVSKIRYVGPGITDGNFDRVECGGEMLEVGETGGSVQWANDKGCGSRAVKLYQCKSCKTIKLV